ncbi:hypothetical protein TCE0_033f08311 [Talaromyces pinophilus]|uniref:Uncharacterized protein n=1 Tax=Talaromyces pinophilus TaxID=128442 RepID=A0A6V8HI89_TALPI|nr:hypothetical protein TCE0_033f08311 [Talaromyces pinophilus]
MAPTTRRNGHHCRVCNNEASTQDAHNADIAALKRAQDELRNVSQSVEQLLNMIGTGNEQQLESLFATTRSGASQEQILAVVRQYTQGMEAQSK